MTEIAPTTSAGSVDLYWLPLGVGGRCVRRSGRVFEALAAYHEHREARDLYHCALKVHLDVEQFVIELAPAWGNKECERGVVGEGPVGLTWLGRSRSFRYELRRWRNGVIPDASEAVGSPQRVSANSGQARQLLELVPEFPTATWGRDEFHAGEMWNSNSLISWLLARSGHDMSALGPPEHGRAPGWSAGLMVAARQATANEDLRITRMTKRDSTRTAEVRQRR